MSTFSEQDLETWITLRKQTPMVDLTSAVMKEIREEPKSAPQTAPENFSHPWLVASGCFLAGVGKLTLVFHLAF